MPVYASSINRTMKRFVWRSLPTTSGATSCNHAAGGRTGPGTSISLKAAIRCGRPRSSTVKSAAVNPRTGCRSRRAPTRPEARGPRLRETWGTPAQPAAPRRPRGQRYRRAENDRSRVLVALPSRAPQYRITNRTDIYNCRTRDQTRRIDCSRRPLPPAAWRVSHGTVYSHPASSAVQLSVQS